MKYAFILNLIGNGDSKSDHPTKVSMYIGVDSIHRNWRPSFDPDEKYELSEVLGKITWCENEYKYRKEIESTYNQLVDLGDYRLTMVLSYAALAGMENVIKGM